MDQMIDKYVEAMRGIEEKMAIQAIRKILREKNIDDVEKLTQIVTVVHSFEGDKK